MAMHYKATYPLTPPPSHQFGLTEAQMRDRWAATGYLYHLSQMEVRRDRVVKSPNQSKALAHVVSVYMEQ